MAYLSDEELLDMYFTGENPGYAFNLIVRKYQKTVYWYVKRLVIVHEDANDIVQDTFLKVWQALAGFRKDAGLYTWIYRIATNEALSFLRKKKRKFLLPLIDVSKQLEQTLESEPYFESRAFEKTIQKAIISLPEKQRVVFHLRYYDEMKYEDMAKVLDTSVGALKASYHHAAKKIEKYINRE